MFFTVLLLIDQINYMDFYYGKNYGIIKMFVLLHLKMAIMVILMFLHYLIMYKV